MFSKLFHYVTVFVILIFVLAVGMQTVGASNQPAITIESLDISSSISEYPLSGASWAIDPWDTGVGHLQATAWFDSPGNIVLAGHSIMPDGTPGIFAHLDDVQIGQELDVFDGGGDRYYTVTDVFTVGINDMDVVMPTQDERITLITCKIGSYDADTQTYTQRLVVVAERAS